ncbi:MAG: VCBS repeat-containing protein [Acidobacteria bacterium]|nr:VCBS repeat-containing protein [Acidobacteriota bacterium]
MLFSVTNPDYELNYSVSITLADIDADGRPELIGIDRSSRIIAFEHDGTFKWRTTQIVSATWSGVLAADLDRNGSVELIAGNQVFSSTGTRLWVGAGAAERGGGLLASTVADLDLDGTLEVIAGPTAYRADGSILWNRLNSTPTLLDGPVAVANFDTDPYPEIVIRPHNAFYL